MDLSVKCLSKSTAFKDKAQGVFTRVAYRVAKEKTSSTCREKTILPITLNRVLDEKSADKIKQVYISDTTEYLDGLTILQKIWNIYRSCVSRSFKDVVIRL